MVDIYTVSINYLAVLVSGIAAMIVGYLWYSPFLFGKPWMKLSGMTMEKISASKSEMPKIYGVSFVTELITAYILAFSFQLVGITTMSDALIFTFWTFIGFVAAISASDVLFSEKRSWTLFLINNGHRLAYLLVMAAILISW